MRACLLPILPPVGCAGAAVGARPVHACGAVCCDPTATDLRRLAAYLYNFLASRAVMPAVSCTLTLRCRCLCPANRSCRLCGEQQSLSQLSCCPAVRAHYAVPLQQGSGNVSGAGTAPPQCATLRPRRQTTARLAAHAWARNAFWRRPPHHFHLVFFPPATQQGPPHATALPALTTQAPLPWPPPCAPPPAASPAARPLVSDVTSCSTV